MTTELEIARKNIEVWKRSKIEFPIKEIAWKFNCITHKSSCQRFLEFLEDSFPKEKDTAYIPEYEDLPEGKKITDLKSAIKEYDDNGI